jgi:hypothetical protein
VTVGDGEAFGALDEGAGLLDAVVLDDVVLVPVDLVEEPQPTSSTRALVMAQTLEQRVINMNTDCNRYPSSQRGKPLRRCGSCQRPQAAEPELRATLRRQLLSAQFAHVQ